MKESVLELFRSYPHLAILISILLSIVVAILGLVPSVFITAANILFFGFIRHRIISFIGETVGAIIAFFLYRKGFRTSTAGQFHKFLKLGRLLKAKNREAFFLIFSLRLIPFVPSGLVTFAAAVGTVSPPVFILASSLGKLPALLLEAWSVYQVTEFGLLGKFILLLTAIVLIFLVLKKNDWKKGSMQ